MNLKLTDKVAIVQSYIVWEGLPAPLSRQHSPIKVKDAFRADLRIEKIINNINATTLLLTFLFVSLQTTKTSPC